MARSLRIQYEGAFYHVTSRGNERKKIFFTLRDYEKIKEYISEAWQKFDFTVHCYVLMSNHYHLLIEVRDRNLPKIMHHINSSYSIYLNTKRKRCGHVFQGRYKAIIVDKDQYLSELSRYIHLNPVRAKMVEKPEMYPFSSYRAYITGSEDVIVRTATILSLFADESQSAKSRYKDFVEDVVGEDLESPLLKSYGGGILGDEDFVNEVLANVDEKHIRNEDISNRKSLAGTLQIESLLARLSEYFGAPIGELISRGDGRRKICVYMLKRHSDASNKAISEVLGGATYSSVAKAYHRFLKELEDNPGLKQQVKALEEKLSYVQARPPG
jgi:putative transposase